MPTRAVAGIGHPSSGYPFDQCNLPFARPFLQPLFAMNGVFDVVEAFEINESVDAISLGEAVGRLRFVLGNAPDKIVCHANVKRAANPGG
jgi:hypothetical protein